MTPAPRDVERSIPDDIDGWIDTDFDVISRGKNNPHRSRSVNFKQASNSFGWDGDFFFDMEKHSYDMGSEKKEVNLPFMSGAGGIDIEDIAQGDLGNCWFLAGIIAATTRPGLIDRVVNPSINAGRNNSYLFSFYHYDRWHDIIVDKRLPMYGCAKAAYSKAFTRVMTNKGKMEDDVDFWVPLLEKAFAKFCGSYDTLNGGITANGLHYLTGGATIKIDISPEQIRKIEDVFDENPEDVFDDFFDFLQLLQKTSILTTSNIDNANGKKYSEKGLIAGHAYSIIDTARVQDLNGKKIDLVRILNPHAGKGTPGQPTEWQGDWSDSSSKWDTLAPAVAKELPHGGDDGDFWMSKDDWLKEFEIMTMCLLPEFFFGYSMQETTMNFRAPDGPFEVNKNQLLKHPPQKGKYFNNHILGYKCIDLNMNQNTFPEAMFVQVTTDLPYDKLATWNLTCLMADHETLRYCKPALGQNAQNLKANNTYMFFAGSGKHSFQVIMSPKSASSPKSVNVNIKVWSQKEFEMNFNQ